MQRGRAYGEGGHDGEERGNVGLHWGLIAQGWGRTTAPEKRFVFICPELVGNKQKASFNIQPSKDSNISRTISEATLHSTFHEALYILGYKEK